MEPADSALLYVIASPVGPYYREGLKGIRLMAKRDAVRAWPGGAGFAKISANYGPCILPLLESDSEWIQPKLVVPPSFLLFVLDLIRRLFGEEEYITETGTMNIFIAWILGNGQKELVDSSLGRYNFSGLDARLDPCTRAREVK